MLGPCKCHCSSFVSPIAAGPLPAFELYTAPHRFDNGQPVAILRVGLGQGCNGVIEHENTVSAEMLRADTLLMLLVHGPAGSNLRVDT
jgi:hypothetical protein